MPLTYTDIDELKQGNGFFEKLQQEDPEAYNTAVDNAKKLKNDLEKYEKQAARQERREESKAKASEFFKNLFGGIFGGNQNSGAAQNTDTKQVTLGDYTKYLLIGGAAIIIFMLFKK